VLALLGAARHKGVSRDKLVGYLWPETDSDGARHLLADSAYVLRGALGEEAVQSCGDTVRLNPDVVHSDLEAFEDALERGDLEEAVRVYGGPFLDGFFISGAREFEGWVEAERERLAGEYAGALESLAERAEAAEDYAEAAEWWRCLAAHDPYNSRVVLHRMKALAAVGDSANAIQCAREHELLLREELGMETAPDVMAFSELLQREPGPISAPLAERVPLVGVEAIPEVAAQPSGRPECRLSLVFRGWGGRVGLGGAAVVALAVAWLLLHDGGAGSAERKSLAVLPFENLTPDPENDYLAAGLHEEVIGQLAKIGRLRVNGRTSVLGYGGNPKDLRLIADELDVDHVLEGSVRCDGDRMRISAQLVDARRGQHLWAESYERGRTDILDIQEDVALSIARALEAELTPGERERIAARPTQSAEAYDLYLRGNEHFRDGELGPAERMYTRAIELDPDFALAFAMLSHTHASAYYFGSDGTPERRAKAREAVDRALELQPDLPEGHRALGRYHYMGFREFERALEEYTIALQYQPNDAETHRYLGLTLRRLGRWEEALEHLERAADLDPRYWAVHMNLGSTYDAMGFHSDADLRIEQCIELQPLNVQHYAARASLQLRWKGDTDEALRILRQWQEISHDPDFVPSGPLFRCLHDHYRDVLRSHTLATFDDPFQYYYLKGQSYDLTGDVELSRAYYDSARVIGEERLDRLTYSPRSRSRFEMQLALVYAGLGRREDAILAGKAAVEVVQDPVEGPNRRGLLAEVYVRLGLYDAAIQELQYACSVNSNCGSAALRLDPVWDPLRSHPRFQALLEKFE
jgi:TolB-like protein/DNA-binding SARP family transcriptional activator/Tfp pilus assembly protein PilF